MTSKIIKKIKLYNFKTLLGYGYDEIRLATYSRFIKGSYSQNGEDLVIERLLGKKSVGFYVDIGANDPTRFNNTKRFYKQGWRGINIEPNPERIKLFDRDRPEDINLNIGIAEKVGSLKFYRFLPDTVSTFSKKEALASQERGLQVEDTFQVDVFPLSDILSKSCKGRTIDLMSIDTEGLDMQVLRSNDWGNYKPRCICIESIVRSKHADVNKQHSYLTSRGYVKVFSNSTNDIYLVNLPDVAAN